MCVLYFLRNYLPPNCFIAEEGLFRHDSEMIYVNYVTVF